MNRYLLIAIPFFLFSSTAYAQPPKPDKSASIRPPVVSNITPWRKWRNQNSAIWFTHDWRVLKADITSNAPWKHLLVRIYKTPGARLNKSGEQAVLYIHDGKKLLYTSDKPMNQVDELGEGQPLYIANVDNDKVAVVSSGPVALSVSVFSYRDGKVRKVLFATSKKFPEFAYATTLSPDDNAYLRILTCDSAFGEPTSLSTVYTWNMKTGVYDSKRVSFAKRFE